MLGGALVGAFLVGIGYRAAQEDPVVMAGVHLGGYDAGGLRGDELAAVSVAASLTALDQTVVVRAGEASVVAKARDLGATPDPPAGVDAAVAVGRSGDPLADVAVRIAAAATGVSVPVAARFDENRALGRLLALAPRVERPSLPTRLDLGARKVLPAARGTSLLAYDSISAVAVGLAGGADTIDLVVSEKPPVGDPLAPIASTLDISLVLGSFDTPYRTDARETDRVHNLKVGATAVSGTVLLPGEMFSFNATVGNRSAHNGYRYATGIAAGELIDVLGGGICQVSSTLFGAAFFAGLDVVEARPHSRPSSYVDMGLDSTVVDNALDLKLRNPFDFPVVLHMRVNQGKVQAEVLGKRRPYQVAFERELKEVTPHRVVWRDDPRLRSGSEVIAQRGMRGFRLERRRQFLQAGEVVKTERWELVYPSTTQIVRRGTNPSGEVPSAKPQPALRDPAVDLSIVQ